MADDDDQEQQGEEEFPHLLRVTSDEQFSEIYGGGDQLICSVFVSAKCDICKAFVPEVGNESKKQEDYQRPHWPGGGPAVRFLLCDVDVVPEAAQRLQLSAVPTIRFSLEGQPFGRSEQETGFSGSNVEKFQKMLRNCYGARNEKLKESDQEKKKKEEEEKKAADAAGGGDD
eukprot:TRINITY_DN4910_c0_g8_i2.p1 TRINITY_DN4910_c0_g8~~TRINITY_DN4910_c0_g8_i2.p1  ORF type:complete len:196 (+),score=100.97 TRINITY_DN4910_c0_g8_i2:74-589(+)